MGIVLWEIAAGARPFRFRMQLPETLTILLLLHLHWVPCSSTGRGSCDLAHQRRRCLLARSGSCCLLREGFCMSSILILKQEIWAGCDQYESIV